jgi:hypothetical protein
MHDAHRSALRGSSTEIPAQLVPIWRAGAHWLRYAKRVRKDPLPTNCRLSLTNSLALRREDFAGRRDVTKSQVDGMMMAAKKMYDEGI